MKARSVLDEAFSSLGRSMTMTIAMIITTVMPLAPLAIDTLVTGQTSCTKNLHLDRTEIQVELNEQISTEDQACSSPGCAKVAAKFKEADGIESAIFQNRQQNSNYFVETFKDSDPVLMGNTTPEPLPVLVTVRLPDPTDISPLDLTCESPQVDHVTDRHEEVGTVAQNLDLVRNTTSLLAAVWAAAIVFLIANMVQIAAFLCRKEVKTTRMTGASRWFTQVPFVPEIVIVSLIGDVLAVGALSLSKAAVIDPALNSLYKAQLLVSPTSSDIGVVAPIAVVVRMVFTGFVVQVMLRPYSCD